MAEYRRAGLESPGVREVQQRADKNRHVVPQLIAPAAANGDLVEITPDDFLHREVGQEARHRLAEVFFCAARVDGEPDSRNLEYVAQVRGSLLRALGSR